MSRKQRGTAAFAFALSFSPNVRCLPDNVEGLTFVGGVRRRGLIGIVGDDVEGSTSLESNVVSESSQAVVNEGIESFDAAAGCDVVPRDVYDGGGVGYGDLSERAARTAGGTGDDVGIHDSRETRRAAALYVVYALARMSSWLIGCLSRYASSLEVQSGMAACLRSHGWPKISS